MELIKTKSFELAILTRGDRNSDKLAVCLPGTLDTKDYVCFPSHLDYLASKGFFAVSFDPPGTWDSPGGINLFTTTNYIKAVNEVIEYFGNKQTLLLGHSRGGQVAMLAGTPSNYVAGLVLINASYSPSTLPSSETIQAGVVTKFRDLPPGEIRTKEKNKFLLPVNFFRDGEQYDSAQALRSCTKPKLIFYSTNDEFMEPEEVKEIYKSLPEPKMIHKLSCAHDYRLYSEIIDEVNEVVGKFLNDYILRK